MSYPGNNDNIGTTFYNFNALRDNLRVILSNVRELEEYIKAGKSSDRFVPILNKVQLETEENIIELNKLIVYPKES